MAMASLAATSCTWLLLSGLGPCECGQTWSQEAVAPLLDSVVEVGNQEAPLSLWEFGGNSLQTGEMRHPNHEEPKEGKRGEQGEPRDVLGIATWRDGTLLRKTIYLSSLEFSSAITH